MLALDSSTLHLSVALVERSAAGVVDIRVLRHEGPPKKQSELLPGLLAEVLEEGGVKLADLEGLALGMGPGSFTGLRLGLATLKALAFTRGLRIGQVSSLAALAFEGPEDVAIHACAIARQDELYTGVYRRTGTRVERLSPEDVDTPVTLAEKLRADARAVVVGPGLDRTEPALRALGVDAARLLPAPRFPSAVAVATLAEFPAAFDLNALFALEPHYLRASEPERNPKFPPLPGPPPKARLKEE